MTISWPRPAAITSHVAKSRRTVCGGYLNYEVIQVLKSTGYHGVICTVRMPCGRNGVDQLRPVLGVPIEPTRPGRSMRSHGMTSTAVAKSRRTCSRPMILENAVELANPPVCLLLSIFSLFHGNPFGALKTAAVAQLQGALVRRNGSRHFKRLVTQHAAGGPPLRFSGSTT